MDLTHWSFNWRYLRGRTPWDTGVTPPEVVALIEGDRLPAGRALDLGCGTGTNCVYLAGHGWEVVGVDVSGLAIGRARRRARRAGVAVSFHRADVSDMPFLREPFDLALDIGCLHSLPPERRPAYAREVTRLARPGGLYMLYAFLPRVARRRAHGLSPEAVRDLFAPAWQVEQQEGGEDPTGPPAAWYWLRRQ